jgi:hypothetical protein
VVQKLWFCVLACTSFNFTKRWLFCLCFVGLFIVGTLSVGIGHNVLALGVVADFGAQSCQYTTNVDAR